MLGVSCHGVRQRARDAACGPRSASAARSAPVREVRERHDADAARRAASRPARRAGRCVACSVCDSSTTSNAPSSNSRRPSSMSACITGTPRGDAGENAVAVDLDAVAVAAALGDQVREQGAVAAAEVEHARAARHQLRDDLEVGCSCAGLVPPCASRNARDGAVVLRHLEQERVVAVRRGDLAERDRDAAPPCSTRTISSECSVSKRQSVSNETTRKRVATSAQPRDRGRRRRANGSK